VQTAHELGFQVADLTFSPVKGPEGNIEFLGHLKRSGAETEAFDLSALVAEAHDVLKG
jgi:23S rRNA (cytidine1920-2'-O)/16S rRNA (cytidine1409-2'-O)-methyltransferase